MSQDVITNTALDSNVGSTKTSTMNVEGIDDVTLHLKRASGDPSVSIWRLWCDPDGSGTFYQTIQVTGAVGASDNWAFGFNTKRTHSIYFEIDTVAGTAATQDTKIVA